MLLATISVLSDEAFAILAMRLETKITGSIGFSTETAIFTSTRPPI